MTDEELIAELRTMGIDAESHKVIALLPLVQVAWADGTIQPAERKLIFQIAEENDMFIGDAGRILDSWLNNHPTEAYVVHGRKLLVELAQRESGRLGETISLSTLDEVLAFCESVALAAGGLFGILWTIDKRERIAIREIAHALDVDAESAIGWGAPDDEAHDDG